MTHRGGAAALLSAAAVRERCAIVLAAAERSETRHFRLDLDRLGAAADRVATITRRRYPDLAVPFHSRWRHFSVGGVERAALVAAGADAAEQARARIDLAFVSVLLDAGAGQGWRFREAETGQVLQRSEGLAVASLRAMQHGLFRDRSGQALAGRRRRIGAACARTRSPTPSITAPATSFSGSTAAPPCCAGWARSAPPTRPISAVRRAPGTFSTTGARKTKR